MANVGLLTMAPKEEREEGTVYGTVREVMKRLSEKNPKLKAWSARNVADSSKLLRLKITDDDGNQEGINCSRSVSALLRSKEITLTQLLDFRVVEHTVGKGYDNENLTMALVIMPDAVEAEGGVEVDAKAKAKESFVQEAPSLKDMLAWS